jgi:hypothetical protein
MQQPEIYLSEVSDDSFDKKGDLVSADTAAFVKAMTSDIEAWICKQ